MRRRDFNLAVSAATLLAGCGGGGGGTPGAAAPAGVPDNTVAAGPSPGPSPSPSPSPSPAPNPSPNPSPSPSPSPAPGPALPGSFVIGTNLASMELAGPGLRYGASTLPNVNYAVPRREEIAWLAANGYTKSRLPIRWEMLQPVLNDTVINTATRAILGNPGDFHAGYAGYITQVLDAHAAAGMKCIIDVHNYCRYSDFIYQSDGSVRGLVQPGDPRLHPYTTDPAQVQTRIFALAPGATLKQSHYIDFVTRVVTRWKDHPGYGGIGLMNEPFYLPRPGTTVESPAGDGQDLTVWPTYARAAINAIRGIDANTLIYLGGNNWNGAWTIGTDNPGWPVAASNIIYDVHAYLDAFSNGNGADWDLEAARGFTAGVAAAPIDANTGVARLQQAVAWAQANGGQRLALTETGMPIDDPRWQQSFQNLMNYARANNVEVYSWAGGSFWFYRNHSINHVPGWHQNKTLEPAQSGPMKAAAGVSRATIYDDGAGWAQSGSVTITVYARGYLASPVTINVSSSNGGSFSKTTLTLAAGANTQDSFTFTPPPNAVVTLTYSGSAPNLPPPRKVYSLSDPVAYAATSLQDAAMAILAKYSACKWDMNDAYTDFVQGAPSAAGQAVRAVSDSGFGSSVGNAMEMVCGINVEGGAAMGSMVLPVMRVVNGHKSADFSAAGTFGLWCRKPYPVPGLRPNPRNRMPYNLTDPHFAIAAVSVPTTSSTGIVLQASAADGGYATELGFASGRAQARWVDSAGNSVVLPAGSAATPNAPMVLSLTSTAGAQQFRLNSTVVGTAGATFASSLYGNDQLLLGSGFTSFFPRDGFGGNLYAAVTGRGVPSAAEMQVLERYLGTTAGL